MDVVNKFDQSGFAVNILVFFILVFGVGFGVYLVQQRTQLKPKATTSDTISKAFTALDSKNKPLTYIGNSTFATSSLSVKLKLKDIDEISTTKSFLFKTLVNSRIVKPALASDIPNDCSSKATFKIGSGGVDFKIAFAYAKTYSTDTGTCIYAPEGTYELSSDLIIPSNTIFFGDGVDKTILKAKSDFGSDKMIGNLNDKDNVSTNIVIRDMTLTGAGLNSAKDTNGIEFSNIKNSYIFNIKVQNFRKDGIYLGYYKLKGEKTLSDISRGTNNVRVSECTGQNNGRNGLSLTFGQNNIIDHCTFSNNSLINPGKVGIAGVALEPDEGLSVSNNQVISNKVSGNGYHGIFLQGCAAKNVRVSENVVCSNEVINSKAPHQYKEQNIIECNGQNNVFANNEPNEIDSSGLGAGSKVGDDYQNKCQSLSDLPNRPSTEGFNSFLGGKKVIKTMTINNKEWNFLNEDFNITFVGDKKKPKLYPVTINITNTDNTTKQLMVYFNYLNSSETPETIGQIPSVTSKPVKLKTCTYTERIPDSKTDSCQSGAIQDCTGTLNGKTCMYNPDVPPNCKKKRCEICNEKSRNYSQCGGTCNGKTYDDKHTVSVQKKVDAMCEISFQCSDQGRKEGQCGNPTCRDDVTYCDGKRSIHKHGGYLDDDTGKCIYDFEDLGKIPGECGNSGDAPSCNDDSTYCDNGEEIYKANGYYDPDSSDADDKGCVYDFQQTGNSC